MDEMTLYNTIIHERNNPALAGFFYNKNIIDKSQAAKWVTLSFPIQNIALIFCGIGDLLLSDIKYRFALSPTWVISDT